MRRLGSQARSRVVILILSTFLIPLAGFSQAANQEAQPSAIAGNHSVPAIAVGFVGGPIPHKVRLYAELAARLREEDGDRIRVEIENNGLRDRKKANRDIRKWLDADGDGKLSDAEKRDARIVLFGHSFGGAAAVAFARDLQRENIPVLLTIQIDSIPKPWQNDHVIPANVAAAINFYQTHGLLHGQTEIVAADPARTEILGNVDVPYDPKAVACHDYPLFFRIISKNHVVIACNPQIWSQVEALINTELFPTTTAASMQQSKDRPGAE